MEIIDKQNTAEVPAPETAERESVWKLGGLSYKQLGSRVWRELYAG